MLGPRARRVLQTAAACAWLAAVLGGFAVLERYKSTPGAPAAAPSDWPAGVHVALSPGKATLVMFAHPKCVCTRASVSELARLMEKVRGKVSAHVLFSEPEGAGEDWRGGELWKRSAAIPGVTVHEDPSGADAARFGAETSGQVVLYDAAGRLRFRGGITSARGHEGESAGFDRMLAILTGGAPSKDTAPVFGCSLKGPPTNAPVGAGQ